MRISRIFRKYSRVLLLVFMSLLLVVFLVGDVIGRAGSGGRMRDDEVGEAFGKPVFLSQMNRAQLDFEITAALLLRTPPVASEDPFERNLAMYLLIEEARRAGIVIGRETIVETLRQSPRSTQQLDWIRQRHNISLNAVYDCAARVIAATVLAQHQAGALAAASVPEVEHAYRDQNQEARTLVSVIDARAFLADLAEPTEEELQAHFEECKNRDPAHTDEERVCGYLISDRVQVEYLTIDPDAIREEVRVSAREAERFYEEHQQDYMKEVEDFAPLALEDSGQSRMIQMTFEEAVDQVREDCRTAKAIEQAQRLVNELHYEARLPWVTAPVDENNVRQPPPADSIVSFEQLRDKFSARGPVTYKKTELVMERELIGELGFGRASAVIDRRPVRAPTLAFNVEGLATPSPEDRTPILRINEPSREVVVETRTLDRETGPVPYQSYLFRVVRIEPSGPPASLDEVRDQVVGDVKQIRAFELAAEQAQTLSDQARQVGLTEAVAAADELKRLLGQKSEEESAEPEVTSQPSPPDPAERFIRALGPVEPERFLRQSRFFRDVGLAPGLSEAVFALADEGQPDSNEEHAVVIAPMATELKYAVAELLEVKPIYQGDFELRREELEGQAFMRRVNVFWNEWFAPGNILARAGFVPKVAPQQ